MDVGKSVTKAIDEVEAGDLESAMLHACNAVDGTAAKAFPNLTQNNLRFTTLLRSNYLTLGVMGMPGINLVETRFPVKVKRPRAAGGQPDLTDVIYGIHRCSHGHGSALPDGFALIPDSLGPPEYTQMTSMPGTIRLSDRIIFGLLAVAVFTPENVGQKTPADYYLTLGAEQTFPINDWWGRRSDFEQIAAKFYLPSVTLDFGGWMT